jgi:tetratricopeptide (TPR) repeat protein/cellulose biosynthesis protein BcsQ
MFTVTFYSYKGGVGRTLALANVAERLSNRGKSVFMLDFDLEAPGLASFFPLDDPDSRGIVEYVSAFADTGVVPPLREYVRTVPTPGGGNGPIHLMRAGRRDAEYQKMLAHLNWKEFYSHRHGYLFVENLKGSIEAEYAPDYVLVDSRTGLTDVSGICTIQLPNAVVFLFGLNDQNLEGIFTIYRSVTDNRLNKPIETLLVASPVPDIPTRAELKEQRLAKAKQLLGRDVDLTLPYSPFVAFSEVILPRHSGTHLGELYDKLADKIIDLNKTDVLTLLKEARRLRVEGDPEQATAKYKDILDTYPTNPEVWTQFGVFLRSTRDTEGALHAFQKALELGGTSSNLAELAITYLLLGREKEAESTFLRFLDRSHKPSLIMMYTDMLAARRKYDSAIAGYTRALELCADDPLSVHPLIGLGNLYMTRKEPEKAVLFFEKAVSIEPSNISATFNLGFALHLVGRTKDSLPLLSKAVSMCEQVPRRMSPSRRANVEQAVGNGYLILGDYEKARIHLAEAITASKSVSSRTVYSSIRYEVITVDEFRDETLRLLQTAEGPEARSSSEAHQS